MRWLILVGMLLLALPKARADVAAAEPPGYRDAIEQAVDELAAHHYEEARALFAQAHALQPNARTHRGLGFAEFELRNYVLCVRELEAALASRVKPLDGELRKETERLLERARKFVAYLVVEARPAASETTVDDVPVVAGDAVMLASGEHEVEFQNPSYVAEKRIVHLRAGERRTLAIMFRTPVAADRETADRRPLRRSAWLWSSVGVIVIGAAVAGTLLALGRDTSRTADPYTGTANVELVGPRESGR